MKKIITILALFATIATEPAFAGTTSESATGALLGAIAGRAVTRNSDSRKQNIATGVGALAGGMLGYSMADRNDRRENRADAQTYGNQGGSFARTVQPVYADSCSNDGWVEQPVVERRVVVQPAIERRVVREVRSEGCDTEYFRGQYDPEAAAAYCEGKRAREDRLRQAYQAGLNGQ